MGYQSGKENTTGHYNSFIGYQAGDSNTVGNSNIFLGYQSGFSNKIGKSNVFIGNSSGYTNNGIEGDDFKGNYNIFIGHSAGMENTEGQSNVYIGNSAGLWSTTGRYNVYLGLNAGAPYGSGTGNYNVNVGAQSESYGSNNVMLGNMAGHTSTTNSSIFIGNKAGYGYITSNTLIIENSDDITTPLIWGNFGDYTTNMLVISGTSGSNLLSRKFFVNGSAGGSTAWFNDSDKRLKKNITTISDALDKVLHLRGVNFEWKNIENHDKGLKMGFIAQEAIKIIPEVVDGSEENTYSMQYAPITAILVEAVKQQQKMIDSLKIENKDLKQKVEKINILQKQIDEINKLIKNKIKE